MGIGSIDGVLEISLNDNNMILLKDKISNKSKSLDENKQKDLKAIRDLFDNIINSNIIKIKTFTDKITLYVKDGNQTTTIEILNYNAIKNKNYAKKLKK